MFADQISIRCLLYRKDGVIEFKWVNRPSIEATPLTLQWPDGRVGEFMGYHKNKMVKYREL